MVCLGLEPRAAGWLDQTNPLSYGGIPTRPKVLYFCWFQVQLFSFKLHVHGHNTTPSDSCDDMGPIL